VTAITEAGISYLLTESKVPGYQQEVDPGTKLAPGATGSWRCVDLLPSGASGLENFGGGNGVVSLQPGTHAVCTATNLLERAIPVGPPETGGGFAPAQPLSLVSVAGLALMGIGALLGAVAIRRRRRNPA
jgi:hypothetical protein